MLREEAVQGNARGVVWISLSTAVLGVNIHSIPVSNLLHPTIPADDLQLSKTSLHNNVQGLQSRIYVFHLEICSFPNHKEILSSQSLPAREK
jgi:hypothetical protein